MRVILDIFRDTVRGDTPYPACFILYCSAEFYKNVQASVEYRNKADILFSIYVHTWKKTNGGNKCIVCVARLS